MRTTERRSSFSARMLRVLRAALLFVISAMPVGATPAFAQITFNVHTPQPGGTHGEPVLVQVTVASPTEVLSVTATAGGRSVALVYIPGWDYWNGSLSLAGLPRGPYTVLIEAQNSGGQIAQVSSVITYEVPAVLHLVEPLNYTIGQPDIRIKASCTDDMPGCTVTLDIGGTGTADLGTPVDMCSGFGMEGTA